MGAGSWHHGAAAPAIATSGLVKTFGSTRALDGPDLSVETKEVHRFLGPNGSGKTTTIRILLGLLRADAGDVTLLGRDPWRDAVGLHRHLAYMPGEVSLWPTCVVVGLLGAVLRLPAWLVDLSPFQRVPDLPSASLTLSAILVISALAAVCTLLGLAELSGGATSAGREDR